VKEKRTLNDLLKSEAERQVGRAADVERLRILDCSMGADLDVALKAEVERGIEKASALERLRQIEARKEGPAKT
jgi:hypothetical protein